MFTIFALAEFSAIQSTMLRYTGELPNAVLYWFRSCVSFCSVGTPYGLFARMTTFRKEVIVEIAHSVDRDGATTDFCWQELRFRFKPDDPALPPKSCWHMPRLDWRLWFVPFKRSPPIWLHRLLLITLRPGDQTRSRNFLESPCCIASTAMARVFLPRDLFCDARG